MMRESEFVIISLGNPDALDYKNINVCKNKFLLKSIYALKQNS